MSAIVNVFRDTLKYIPYLNIEEGPDESNNPDNNNTREDWMRRETVELFAEFFWNQIEPDNHGKVVLMLTTFFSISFFFLNA